MFTTQSAERPLSLGQGVKVQSTSVKDRYERDVAPIVPELPTAAEARSGGFKNYHLVIDRPSIGRRMFRALARFLIAVLIAVGAALAWQSYGNEATEMARTWTPSVAWLLPVSTTKSPPNGQEDAAILQSAVATQMPAPSAAATSPELVQLEPMAHDLAVMRRSLEQLAANQEQMAQSIATVQAVEQDIRQKISSPPQSPVVPVPPRKPPKPVAQSSSVPRPPVPTGNQIRTY
jgi:hypothetical protein